MTYGMAFTLRGADIVRSGSNYGSAGPCSSVGVGRRSRDECGFPLSHTEQCCTEVEKLGLGLGCLGDERAADAVRFVVLKHAAAIAMGPPSTSSPADVAVRGLRSSVWFDGTVHHPRKAWCASA